MQNKKSRYANANYGRLSEWLKSDSGKQEFNDSQKKSQQEEAKLAKKLAVDDATLKQVFDL